MQTFTRVAFLKKTFIGMRALKADKLVKEQVSQDVLLGLLAEPKISRARNMKL